MKSLLLLTLTRSSFAASPIPIPNLPGSGTDPAAIDYDKLPRFKGTLTVVNHAAPGPRARRLPAESGA